MQVCWLVEIFDGGEWRWMNMPDGRIPVYFTRRQARDYAWLRFRGKRLRIKRVEMPVDD